MGQHAQLPLLVLIQQEGKLRQRGGEGRQLLFPQVHMRMHPLQIDRVVYGKHTRHLSDSGTGEGAGSRIQSGE